MFQLAASRSSGFQAAERIKGDDGVKKPIVQRAFPEERMDGDSVVPNVEDAAEELRNQRSERDPRSA
jgi:hypothetical protein